MKFSYKAKTKEGELQVGNVEAANREEAINILLGHDLYVLGVEEVRAARFYDNIFNFFRRVKQADVMSFTRQFATLVASQVPLSDGLTNLYRQATNPVLKEVVAEVSGDIKAGFALSQALEKHPTVFSEFYINMVKSAEVTGRLSEVLDFLADYLEKQSVLISKVKNALIYPAFVIALFFVVVIVMVTLVFPQIIPIFEEAQVELPALTSLLLGAGTFIARWWIIFVVIFIILVIMFIDYIQTREGKAIMDELSLRLPVIGGLFQKLYVSRFAESTRVLIMGGLTIPQAVEISSHTIGNSVYQEILHEIAGQIRRGQLLSQSVAVEKEFPPLVSQLISVGEQTGRLDQLLGKISDFYSREVENIVNNLVTLIQPALMLLIGLMVAGLFASILLPLYNLSQGF